jgi:hypothetical protein
MVGGLELVAHNEELQEAIRRRLAGDRMAGGGGSNRRQRTRRLPADALAALSDKRRKLLDLYYAGKITDDGFAEAELRLAEQIEAVRSEAGQERARVGEADELAQRFQAVVATLSQMDLESLWGEAEAAERRVLIEELVEGVTVFPDHLVVGLAGVPSLNVTFEEVGLRSQIGGVGGGT